MNIRHLLFGFVWLILFSGCEKREFNGAIISTGIIDFNEQKSEALQSFDLDHNLSNLIQFMESKNTIKHLTHRLLIHDLNSMLNKSDSISFKSVSIIKTDLSNYNIPDLVDYMESSLANFNENVIDELKEERIQNIAHAFGYDHDSILQELEIERVDDTDHISIEFLSADPGLSYFATSNYCNDFFRYYEHLQTYQSQKKVDFFTELLNKKKALLATKKESLQNLSSEIPYSPNFDKLNTEIALLERDILEMPAMLETAIEHLNNIEISIKLIRAATLEKK